MDQNVIQIQIKAWLMNHLYRTPSFLKKKSKDKKKAKEKA